ncbi:MAG: molybdopterin-dependent oxidoreductase [Candidatus Geothermarchaeales archaeon]
MQRSPLSKISRRDFIKATAAAGAAVTLGGLFNELMPHEKVESVRGNFPIEGWKTSTCLLCPAGCSVLIRTINDRAVKVEGNPLSPNNRGILCPRGHTSLQILYNPDRIRKPLYRSTRDSSWKSLEWKQALSILSGKLRGLREDGRPHQFVWMGGDYGALQELISRFLKAYGTPNFVRYFGVPVDVGFNLGDVNYFLLFGADLLGGWGPIARFLRAYGHSRRGRPIRSKMVVADSMLSITGVKADEWIKINPGTSGALSLGITNVIISEKLYGDHVRDSLKDFEDFKELILGKYSLEWSSETTGVPVDTIQRIAREFASTKPSIALGGGRAYFWDNGYQTQLAIRALNLLVGNVRGTVKFEPPFKPFPDVELDGIAAESLRRERINLAESNYVGVADAILGGKPYKPEVILVHGVNPLFDSPEPERFREAFEEIPFIVSTSPFMGEVEELTADLIIPDEVSPQRWGDYSTQLDSGEAYASISKPVVGETYTRNVGDLVIGLSRELGGVIDENMPWQNFYDVLRYRWSGVWESGIGYVGPKPVASFKSFDGFWGDLLKHGFWWGVKEGLAERLTPSDLHASELQWRNPTYVGGEEEYPFVLNTYGLMVQDGGKLSNCPWTLEHQSPLFPHLKYLTWVEINPEDAERIGVNDGEPVYVENPKGKRMKCIAKTFRGAKRGVVSVPFGLGHRAYGKWAKNVGGNPYELTIYEWNGSYVRDPVTGTPSLNSTRVRVYGAGGG